MFPFVGGSDTRSLTPRGIYPELTILHTSSGETSDWLKPSHTLCVSFISLASYDTCITLSSAHLCGACVHYLTGKPKKCPNKLPFQASSI